MREEALKQKRAELWSLMDTLLRKRLCERIRYALLRSIGLVELIPAYERLENGSEGKEEA